MKDNGIIFQNVIILVLLSIICVGGSGCQQEQVAEAEYEPIFFPPPPIPPKLQFLTSFSGDEASSNQKSNFMESFVFGETDNTSTGAIAQPYGVAIHKGKIYVCDVGQNNIKILDIANNTLEIFRGGRSLKHPMDIFIEPNGTKYISDTSSGAVIVYNDANKLIGFLGKNLGIKPSDTSVRGDKIYLTDANSNQVYVLDKRSGELLDTIGRNLTDQSNWEPDEFALIAGLALDDAGGVYVTDKLKGMVTKFDSSGVFERTFSRHGALPDCLVRPKGIALDRENRLWVVDAGPSMAVKVYRNEDGRFLMIFGMSGVGPGQMYLPATIVIDYDHVDLFKEYAVEGAELEFLVLVTNQYGPHKVSVYGFGTFPEKYSLQGVFIEEEALEKEAEPSTDDETKE